MSEDSGVEWGYEYRLTRSPSGQGMGHLHEHPAPDRASAEEQVRELLTCQPGKWEAGLLWRTPEVKAGPWQRYVTPAQADALAAEEGEPLDPEPLAALLALVKEPAIPAVVIATWTRAERAAAADWASAEHADATDVPVERLEEPECVRAAAEVCESQAMAQLAIEMWSALTETAERYPAAYSAPGIAEVMSTARAAFTGLLVLLGGSRVPRPPRPPAAEPWQQALLGVLAEAYPEAVSVLALAGLLEEKAPGQAPGRMDLARWLAQREPEGFTRKVGGASWRATSLLVAEARS